MASFPNSDAIDHPIFTRSVQRIRQLLPATGLQGVQEEVLLRLIHSSGDPGIAPALRCSAEDCNRAMAASPAVRPSSPIRPWLRRR